MIKIIEIISNYIKLKKWFLIERDLNDLIVPVEPFSDQLEVIYDIDLAVSYIKGKFYENEIDEGEKAEFECAKKNNHEYVVIKDRGKVIGFIKYGTGEVYIRNMRKKQFFEKDIVFIYAVYTDKDYRGRHLFPFVNTEIMKKLKKEGFKYIRAQVDTKNKSVLKSFHRCGYYKITDFYTLRFFLLNFSTVRMGLDFIDKKKKSSLI